MDLAMCGSFRQQKRFIFDPRIPWKNTTIGQPYRGDYNSASNNFVVHSRQRLSTEWTPQDLCRPDPPLMVQPSEIYHRNIGQLPGYTGYIPGQQFRYGKTYGTDSKDGKRWIRGDFS